MKVVFKGRKGDKARPCPVCGHKRKTTSEFQTVRTYYLPSGTQKTFRIGRCEEVSDTDGEFLLSLEGGVFDVCG